MTLNPEGTDLIMIEATLSAWPTDQTILGGGPDEDLDEDLDEEDDEDDDLEDEEDLEDDDEDEDDEDDDIEAMTRVP
jgi:hypothetical protein